MTKSLLLIFAVLSLPFSAISRVTEPEPVPPVLVEEEAVPPAPLPPVPADGVTDRPDNSEHKKAGEKGNTKGKLKNPELSKAKEKDRPKGGPDARPEPRPDAPTSPRMTTPPRPGKILHQTAPVRRITPGHPTQRTKKKT